MPRWLPILLVAVLLLAPVITQALASQDLRRFEITPDNGVVMSRDAAASVAATCSRPFPSGLTGYWVPLPSDLARLETTLAGYLDERIPFEQRPRTPTVPILRQYVGMYRSGRKVIYVNGFNGDPVPQLPWRTELLRVCDGGPTNFGLVFDTATGAFTDFLGNPWF